MRADAAEYFRRKLAFEKKREKWDLRFLDLAAEISSWSKDPSTQIGAVIADGNVLVSVGYNGLPRGMKDDERLEDREWKYKTIIHGEINAIHHANRPLKGCTLYNVPFMPCSVCASQIIQVGISRVVTRHSSNPRWQENFVISKQNFSECGVDITLYEEL